MSSNLADRQSICSCGSELDGWVVNYNTIRRYQGIGMITSITHFESLGVSSIGPNLDATAANARRTSPDLISRQVGANGVVSMAWQQISVGKHRGGYKVDIYNEKDMVQIVDGSELIKCVLQNRPGEVIRKRNEKTIATI